VKAWMTAIASAIATAAIALLVIAPIAQSSKHAPGLKLVTVENSGTGGATAKCPKRFVPIGGGFKGVDGSVRTSVNGAVAGLSKRSWRVEIDAPGGQVSAFATCAKGTGGFKLKDMSFPQP
jgi:hypothetical protein